MRYKNTLTPLKKPWPILADYPAYIEPLAADACFQAPALVEDPDGTLSVRSWRYWYNARGIVVTENRLEAQATAVVVVHPWGIDDGHGLRSPEPAGVGFFCTCEKNAIGLAHMREVLNPFLKAVRDRVGLVAYSLPGSEDNIRRQLYASIRTEPEALDVTSGERALKELVGHLSFRGDQLVPEMILDDACPLPDYFRKATSTDAGDAYNGPGFWDLPMPLSSAIEHSPQDRIFYDAEGYHPVCDFLKRRGIRHVLLAGYCTDMCVARTTCGYDNFCRDFNVFLVGDATLATFPGSCTPKYATQAALANAALEHMVTQIRWVRFADVEKR